MKRLAVAAIACIFLQAPALADQPNMESAIKNLEQAKNNLQQATSDKGGHRAKAINLIDDAIRQVKVGMEYDRTHGTDGNKKNK